MKLTATQIKNVKPTEKPQKLSDGGGMFLLIQPTGAKLWRLSYRYDGKQKTLSLGKYPIVGLAEARERRHELKKMLEQGIDPGAARKATKTADSNTFEFLAKEWHEKFKATWSKSHASRIWRRLEKDVMPYLGARPVKDITPPELLATMRRIEGRGAVETAHRVLQSCGAIFRYGIATGRADRDISADLRGAIPPTKVKHHPSITDPDSLGKLLCQIDGYEGSEIARCALRLAPLVFVRPGELRHAEWSEINLDGGEWRIPAVKMKMREQHIVPLSTQAVAILRDLLPLTGSGSYVFPSVRTDTRPMSENTVNAALRRLGYTKDEMTGHGFRSVASTLLHEQGWPSAAIERQLAHGERNKVKAAYNYAQYLEERREMMQSWSDYLDGLKSETR